MAWTNPTRYPNSMEIANNEAFLNTNVIDNLIYLKENSGGGGGNFTLIETKNATVAATSVLISNCFTTTYSSYVVLGRAAVTSPDAMMGSSGNLNLTSSGTNITGAGFEGTRASLGTTYSCSYNGNWSAFDITNSGFRYADKPNNFRMSINLSPGSVSSAKATISFETVVQGGLTIIHSVYGANAVSFDGIKLSTDNFFNNTETFLSVYGISKA
jgi:hypothetical protein